MVVCLNVLHEVLGYGTAALAVLEHKQEVLAERAEESSRRIAVRDEPLAHDCLRHLRARGDRRAGQL